MKRAISMLGALALVAGFFTLGAPAAQAAINCTVVGGSQQNWPYTTTRYCGTATFQNGSLVASNLNSIYNVASQNGSAKHAGAQLVFGGAGAPFYIFKNKNEFITYWNEQNPNPPPGVTAPVVSASAAGITVYSGTIANPTAALYSVIFVQTTKADGSTSNTNINNATVHEAGHWFDLMYDGLLQSATTRSSDSNSFVQNLQVDWNNLNNVSLYKPCTTPGNVFNTQKDYLGHLICSGTSLNTTADTAHGSPPATHTPPPFSGNNETVLKAVWPDFFSITRELWAEEVAKELGATDGGGNQSISGYFKNSQFICTRTLIRSLIKYGAKPGVSPSPIPWPTPSGHQTCYTGN